MIRLVRRALGHMSQKARRACSFKLVRESRFLSINANNHLVLRVPAWSDAGYRISDDIILIWPQATKPSIMTQSRFRRESRSRFHLIPHFNLCLPWDEALSLSAKDWRIWSAACDDALSLVRTRRWVSNVVVD